MGPFSHYRASRCAQTLLTVGSLDLCLSCFACKMGLVPACVIVRSMNSAGTSGLRCGAATIDITALFQPLNSPWGRVGGGVSSKQPLAGTASPGECAFPSQAAVTPHTESHCPSSVHLGSIHNTGKVTS